MKEWVEVTLEKRFRLILFSVACKSDPYNSNYFKYLMLTYSHGVIGYLAYLKGSSSAKKYAVWGSITPDLLLVFGFLFQVFNVAFDGSTAHEIHMAVHRAAIPQAITNSLHSIAIVAPIALIVFLMCRSIFPFFAGILLQIAVDFLTHQEWPYNHLYPFEAEPIVAILSFWNPWFMAIEHGLLLVLSIIYLRRRLALASKFASIKNMF